MKKTVLLLAFIVLAILPSLAGNDVVIKQNQLPKPSQAFIKKHFKDLKVASVKKDGGWGDEYEVKFDNGTSVEFNKKGTWTEVDCKPNAVPAAIVPEQISTFVASKFKSRKIVKIEHQGSGYEVELSNGTEIEFNKNFKAVKIDD